jgi:hypothetical protein
MAHDRLDGKGTVGSKDLNHQLTVWGEDGVTGGNKQSLFRDLYSCGSMFWGLEPETQQNSFELPLLYPLASWIRHELSSIKDFRVGEAVLGRD